MFLYIYTLKIDIIIMRSREQPNTVIVSCRNENRSIYQLEGRLMFVKSLVVPFKGNFCPLLHKSSKACNGTSIVG